MKTLIVFREGHSGRFLQSVIQDTKASQASYRMEDLFRFNLMGTHELDLDKQQKEYDIVLRILPQHNIYNAIYNIFTKKTLLEEFPQFKLEDWKQDIDFWYDKCFYLIDEYHTRIRQDICNNQYPNVVNFEKLTDEHYLDQVMQQYYNVSLTDNQRKLIQNYSRLQLSITLADDNQKEMTEIIEHITDQMLSDNPWFFAYCVFKFEKNNNLAESARLWSINNIITPPTRKKLLEIATQYR
jgi:hypothetical protein